ncbi:nucleotidyltransferase domain-containing protein [Desulfonatronum parangueonense]
METLAGCPEVERAILFGSRAMGNYRKGSDIDIALMGDRVSPRTIAHLSVLLNERQPLPYHFDLVDYSHVESLALKQHIDEHGVEIWRSEDFSS